jgi:hypothetical protein
MTQLLSPQRGLTAEVIAKKRYRTLPSGGRIRLARRVSELADLRGVPGFYLFDSRLWCLAGPAGLVIPVRDFDGKIRGLQIRRDDPSGPRYVWLSSSNPKRGSGGTSARTWFHVAPGDKGGHECWITEGPLKADIAAMKTGNTFVAVPGVNCWKSSRLVPEMRARGIKSVVVCYDSDLAVNSYVAGAAMELAGALKQAGLRVRFAWWRSSYGKGIDDLLLAGKTPWILTESSWLRRLRT